MALLGNDVVDGGLKHVVFAAFSDPVQQFSILRLEGTDFVQVGFLNGFQPFYLVFEELLFLDDYLRYFCLAAVEGRLEYF